MNVKFFVNIDSDNDAFQEGNAAAEVQRILLKIARQIVVSDGEVIKDVNGNTVGKWGLMTDDEEEDDVEIDLGDFTPLFWTEGPSLPRLVDPNARRLASGDYTLCPICGEELILWEELMRFGGCDKCTGDADC